VYCDILEHVVVGDIMAPLLRIVNTEVTRSNAVDQIMNPPLVATCTKQSGSVGSVFVVTKRQPGHGFGNILSGLFRNATLPLLKRNVGSLAGNVLKTGAQVLDDVVRGKSLKDTVKKRIPEAIKAAARDIDWQTGSGQPERKRRRRRHKDIFSN